MMRLKGGAAALIEVMIVIGTMAIAMYAPAAAFADKIQNPVPAPGQTLSYTMSGTGTGALMTPGSDQSMALEIQTDLALQRKVTDVKPDGTVTTLEKVTQNDVMVNGQDVALGTIPPITITTDPSGKITLLSMQGQPESANPAVAQLGMMMWQLSGKDYKAGDTWTYVVPLNPGAANDHGSILTFTQTYVGLKPLKVRTLMEVTSHLQAPVTVKPHTVRSVGGFSLNSVKIGSVDQTAFFDPDSGALVSSDINLVMDLGLQMGQGDAAMAMNVKMPLMVKTQLVKNAEAPAAAPNPPAAPSPNTPESNPPSAPPAPPAAPQNGS